jgi:aspartate/methionine/tyrosine aminotransferase
MRTTKNFYRVIESQYMYWAKTRPKAKYDLANSGLTNYPIENLYSRLKDVHFTGKSEYGYPPLINKISKLYDVPTKFVYTTLGASFANFMVMTILFEPDAEILIEHPTYELFISTARYIGYKVKRFHRPFENNFQIDISDLKKSISKKTKLIFITNLHNPSSAFTDNSTLEEIGRIAKQTGAYVCVDEVYLDSAFELNPSSSIQLGNNFIVTNSLTKVYGLSDLRCGWVLAKPELIQRMWRLTDLFYVKHTRIAEQLSTLAFQELNEIKKWSASILNQNQKILNKFVPLYQDLEIFHPGFGTVIFPYFKQGKIEKLYNLLKNEYDTLITPGRFFGLPDFFRIGLGCKPSLLKIGLKNISDALDSFS